MFTDKGHSVVRVGVLIRWAQRPCAPVQVFKLHPTGEKKSLKDAGAMNLRAIDDY